MGLFSSKHQEEATPAPVPSSAQATEDLGMQSGKVNLSKGQRVSMVKTPVITATCSWESETDYDVYAIVGLTRGEIVTAAQFGTEGHPNFTPVVVNGAVKHMGDVGRGVGGNAQEVIEIRMTDQIAFVVIVAYSAQSNGSGSFFRYKVSLEINNGSGTVVGIDAKNASDNDSIYTCIPGIIWNKPDGVSIEACERYSSGGEKRPLVYPDGRIAMDEGERNLFK